MSRRLLRRMFAVLEGLLGYTERAGSSVFELLRLARTQGQALVVRQRWYRGVKGKGSRRRERIVVAVAIGVEIRE